MALGADGWSVARLVTLQGLGPGVVGVALGAIGSLAVGGAIQGLLYGVGAHDPATYAAVCVLTVLVVLLACVVPARRAARIPPSAALRME